MRVARHSPGDAPVGAATPGGITHVVGQQLSMFFAQSETTRRSGQPHRSRYDSGHRLVTAFDPPTSSETRLSTSCW